ncbi:MAG: TonB-dependent receptor, partial [Bacteroidaceae bacterium]|nr:TonB-dependent receptor [Bacteroidaceae bacterium]
WKFYASYNKGFRLPTFTDLYYKSPTLSGNTDLRPEVNRSMQVGAQYSRPGLHTTLRAFYHRGHNMIDWVMYTPTDIYHSASFNLDNMGVQADAKIDFSQLLKKEIFIRSFSVGYTYINQKRHNSTEIYKSNYALEYLRHKLTATLHHGIAGHLTATWSLRWQDRMGGYIRYDAARPASDSEQLTPYRPYATLDLKLQWAETRWLVYVTGSNLTNCRYYDFGNIRQPGIWALAGARINFNL